MSFRIMFEDVFDAARMLFNSSWPTADAEITDVYIERLGDRIRQDDQARLCVCYRFYVSDDGPYSGISFWKPTFTFGLAKRMRDARKQMLRKHIAAVHYRPDDPSQNRLAREAWRDL